MTGYEPNPFNAALEGDILLVRALNDCDTELLAVALERGGGSPNSTYLEYLIEALRRNCQRELVRKLGRGKSCGGIFITSVEESWLKSGIPADIRSSLITGILAGEFILRRRKVAGAVGRPTNLLFGSEATDGAEIERLQRERGRGTEDAITAWSNGKRVAAGRGKLNTQQQKETWDRRARRGLAKWRSLKGEAAEIDN